MSENKYLVTAAAGKTGLFTVKHLLDAGHHVRAFVHQRDERSRQLEKVGAEIFVGDLLNHDDSIQATSGMKGAYLCYPVRPGFIQATAYFADAARQAGLKVVVNMSQISAREDAKSHAARDHWIAERVLDWSGVPTVHIRPTFFSEWLTFPWVLDTIVKQGNITLPYGNGRHAPIAAQDQARFIARVLSEPEDHVGRTYKLRGPVELSQQEIADRIGAVIGRKIVYRPTTLDEYREHLKGYGLTEFMIQHFIEVAIDYQNGVFGGEDDVIANVTGRSPQTVEEFVMANRKAFAAN